MHFLEKVLFYKMTAKERVHNQTYLSEWIVWWNLYCASRYHQSAMVVMAASMRGKTWLSARKKKKITTIYDAHDGVARMMLVKINDVLRTMAPSHMVSGRYAFHSGELIEQEFSCLKLYIRVWVLVRVLFNHFSYHYCWRYIKKSWCLFLELLLPSNQFFFSYLTLFSKPVKISCSIFNLNSLHYSKFNYSNTILWKNHIASQTSNG